MDDGLGIALGFTSANARSNRRLGGYEPISSSRVTTGPSSVRSLMFLWNSWNASTFDKGLPFFSLSVTAR